MVIDRRSRSILSNCIDQYLNCQIENYELDDQLFALRSKDKMVHKIGFVTSNCYSEFHRHHNQGKWQLPESVATTMRRWIVLLESDREWDDAVGQEFPNIPTETLKERLKSLFSRWQRPKTSLLVVNPFWPFRDSQHWADF